MLAAGVAFGVAAGAVGVAAFVVDAIDANVRLASRNLAETCVKNYKDFSTMDVLTCDTIVMSKAALEKLPERFKD